MRRMMKLKANHPTLMKVKTFLRMMKVKGSPMRMMKIIDSPMTTTKARSSWRLCEEEEGG